MTLENSETARGHKETYHVLDEIAREGRKKMELGRKKARKMESVKYIHTYASIFFYC